VMEPLLRLFFYRREFTIYIPFVFGEWNKIMLNDRIAENIPLYVQKSAKKNVYNFPISHVGLA